MNEIYIGLMSGTSADGIDAALVDFSDIQPKLINSFYQPYSSELRQMILSLCQPGENEINRLGELDVLLGKAFAAAANQLIKKSEINPQSIRAIGSHGQTVRHHPTRQFTLQIGDPNIITAETGITTIADFRRRDMALGGQGAPLVPAFHQHVFAKKNINRCIVNIGGIANVTFLPDQGSLFGFDTGPGNTLMDAWVELHLGKTHDKDGEWAKQGKVHYGLLDHFLNDPYFNMPTPKSTGREYFNIDWLKKFLPHNIEPVDVQATLAELTAVSILKTIQQYISEGDILICGGGVHNQFLISRMKSLAPHFTLESTLPHGIDPDWVEAMAFAWLAKQTLERKPGNVISVTGANQKTVLGGVYFA